MSLAPSPRTGPRPAAIALILAWLLLLGVLAAAAGYVFLGPQEYAGDPAEQTGAAGTLPKPEAAPPETPANAPPQAPASTEPPAAPQTAEQPQAKPAESEPAPAPPPPPQAAGVETPKEPAATPQAPPPPEPAPEPVPEPKVAPKAAPEPPPVPETAAAPEPPPPSPPSLTEKAPTIPEVPAAKAPDGEQLAALPKPIEPGIEPTWRRNAQPFDEADTRPRVAVVLTGLGLASSMTEAAIKTLPGGVTLSFTPYSRKLNQWIALARVNGHEVMLDLPMEPTTYPSDDPGPQALLTALSSRQNLERLRWTLERATGYVGVATVMGSRFTASETHISPILEELKGRGLLFLDNRASDASVAGQAAAKIGVPWAINDRALDWSLASRVAIDARLVQLENMARTQGFAVAMGRPYPVTIERLREWAEGLEGRGLVLAPISALADKQPLRKTAVHKAQTE